MATALLISRADLVKNTIVDGNVDTNKFIQLYTYSTRNSYTKLFRDIFVRSDTANDYCRYVKFS